MTIKGEILIDSEKQDITCPTGGHIEKDIHGFNLQLSDFGQEGELLKNSRIAGEVSLEGQYEPKSEEKQFSYIQIPRNGSVDYTFSSGGRNLVMLKLNHETEL